MKRNQKLLPAAARGVLGLILVLVSSLVLTACEERNGVVEGTVRGADPSAARVEVVIYELRRSEEVPGMDVFQKGAILQRVLVDENGNYAVTLPGQEYILQVWWNGIEVADQLVEVRSGRTTRLDIEITPPFS